MTAPIQISGGNYPLIQQPSPFMELAATIQGIQAQRQAREMQILQRQQIMAAIQHLGAQTAQERAQTEYTQGETANLPARRAQLQAQTDEAVSLSHLHTTQDKAAQRTADQEHETRVQTQMGSGLLDVARMKGVDPNSPRYMHIVGEVLGRTTDPAAHLALAQRAAQYVTDANAQRAGAQTQETADLQHGFDARHPFLAGASTRPGVLGYLASQQKRDTIPRPTPVQTQNAELGASALASWRNLEAIRTSNPSVETEVGRVLSAPKFIRALPFFHSAGDAATAAAAAGASPAAQNYLRNKWGFMDNIIRTRIPGGRMSAALFTQYASEFMPGLDAEANATMRQNELQGLATAQGQSGYDVNPDIWHQAAKRHGVDTIDIPSLVAGGTGSQTLDEIHRRYPPREP